MDEQAGELLVTLCRRSAGDVHLDLADVDSIDLTAVIALLRGAASMADGRHLVLHNPPSCLGPILAVVGEAIGDSGVRVM
jgi:hypothetical protein